jgi:sugar phosphate isomerase/epimerase
LATYTRREFQGLLAGGLIASPLVDRRAAQQPNSRVAGVRLGAQTYSFRGMSIDDTVAAMASIGLSYCELWQGQIETAEMMRLPPAPPGPDGARRGGGGPVPRLALRTWRETVPLDVFRDIRRKFDAAGITLTAYNLSFENDCTDAEIDRGFEMAQALGVDVITASSKVSFAARVAPFAEKHRITFAFHNHSSTASDEVVSPESFAAVTKAGSRVAINLDIGHFTAANHDPVAFLDANHAKIVSLHIKDRKRNDGANTRYGEGDTPIAAVLRRLRDRKWDIPAQMEYEYRGENATTEVAKCLAYCKSILNG